MPQNIGARPPTQQGLKFRDTETFAERKFDGNIQNILQIQKRVIYAQSIIELIEACSPFNIFFHQTTEILTALKLVMKHGTRISAKRT